MSKTVSMSRFYTPKQKQILVAGGAGFLGSHLCERLISEGHAVFCLDNLSTGKKENIDHLLVHKHFKFIQQDVGEALNINFFLDEIYNFACPASPCHYQENPISTIKTNLFGTYSLLELAKTCNAKIFQASTSEIYGDPVIHPQNESYWGNVNPIGVRACYNESKRCAETLFFDYHRFHGSNIKVARIFNTYGPRMNLNDGRVISTFIVQALTNEPITIYGKGIQTRSFCFVKDLIDGILSLMATSDDFTGPVNLGNDDEYTVMDLALKIIGMTNSKSQIIFKPLPEDDPKRRRPDLNLAKRVLNYDPQISLEQGLNLTITYFANLLDNQLVEHG